jgi:hypothetical protein
MAVYSGLHNRNLTMSDPDGCASYNDVTMLALRRGVTGSLMSIARVFRTVANVDGWEIETTTPTSMIMTKLTNGWWKVTVRLCSTAAVFTITAERARVIESVANNLMFMWKSPPGPALNYTANHETLFVESNRPITTTDTAFDVIAQLHKLLYTKIGPRMHRRSSKDQHITNTLPTSTSPLDIVYLVGLLLNNMINRPRCALTTLKNRNTYYLRFNPGIVCIEFNVIANETVRCIRIVVDSQPTYYIASAPWHTSSGWDHITMTGGLDSVLIEIFERCALFLKEIVH